MSAARAWIAVAAANGFIAVAAGAFGAHALKERLAPDLRDIFDLAARYQIIHALAMLAAGLLVERWSTDRPRVLIAAAWCFFVGIVLFSGSLYALSLSGVRAWGAVTPFGGAAFLAGWLLLMIGAMRGGSAGGAP
ncbi:MAG: DUF423 domain-containing protein [Phycisphaerae bacterium]|nr:DUF423 domain-containing protein [Phycisphaerae bacterium]NUQ45671.1 DUF423 domain-containing protein [Phycisphaerae bacterium]